MNAKAESSFQSIKRKEVKMTQENNKPTHRVSFSRIVGTDEQGNDKLGSAREIGAIWARKGDKKGGILKFDHMPIELTKHEGVIFIVPVEDK